jgi:hypothetical protein
MTPKQERDCLGYQPFQGDETYVRELTDRFVVTRKDHQCVVCWGAIPTGARVRAKREINREDDVAKTFYFCESCCAAMVSSWTDNGEEIEKRTAMGIRASRALPKEG